MTVWLAPLTHTGRTVARLTPVSERLNDVSKLSKSHVAYRENFPPPKSSSWAHWVICLDWLVVRQMRERRQETMQSMNSVRFVSWSAKNKPTFENTFCIKMSCENIHRSVNSKSIFFFFLKKEMLHPTNLRRSPASKNADVRFLVALYSTDHSTL